VSLYGHWLGSSVVHFSAEAFVVDVDHDSRAPIAYSGYATRSWDVAPDTDLSWTPDPAPSPFATEPIHVNLSVPSGYRFANCNVSALEESGRQIHFLGQLRSFEPEDLVVPDLPDTTFTVGANAGSDATGDGFTAVAAGVHAGDYVTLEAHRGPMQLLPDDGAVVGPDTDFTWTGSDGAVYRLAITANDGDAMQLYVIQTTDPSARLPDLSALGMPFPAGQTLAWQVFTYDGLTLDGFAASAQYGSYGSSSRRTGTAAE
jgi:hypothetical protein